MAVCQAFYIQILWEYKYVVWRAIILFQKYEKATGQFRRQMVITDKMHGYPTNYVMQLYH